ncbi:MAG: integrase [Rhodobiaceae bacterium]|nr:integrase [Rhodobiaceae bacterium]MCC0055868.1 integrase [Rhodobiaceae bacterium]
MRVGGIFRYKRRVPTNIAHRDARSPHVRVSLKTDDVAIARAKRDLLEAADDALWASLMLDEPSDPAMARYHAAMRRVEALGFTYRSAHNLALNASIDDLLARIDTVRETPSIGAASETARALLGGVPTPPTTISQAFDIYVDEIVADELLGKSAVQKAQWKKVKQRAVNNFVQLVGDKAMTEISRDDAMRIYRHWLLRIAPKDGRPTHSASSGNRDLGNLRVLYEAYFAHVGEPDRQNPFARLSFLAKRKRSRPPFPTSWIVGKIMKPGALATMNDEARGIALALIETGARPSELCNLHPSAIRLSSAIPHLAIEPRDDPDDPREIKTASSERLVPLVGVALAVFEKHREGFPRYRNRENDLSATLNKYFRENRLFPSPAHKIYSFRHSFEDRMKEGNLDEELRRLLMGHTIERPKYGAGGSLKWRHDELRRIALPFDPSIV